jgi:hypothetical protein
VRKKTAFRTRLDRWIVVERCESSVQFISWLPRLDKFPRFAFLHPPAFALSFLSCFHVSFITLYLPENFHFPQHSTELLLKAEQTHNTPRDEILISEGKETFSECVKIMKRIRNETIRGEKEEKVFYEEIFPG